MPRGYRVLVLRCGFVVLKSPMRRDDDGYCGLILAILLLIEEWYLNLASTPLGDYFLMPPVEMQWTLHSRD